MTNKNTWFIERAKDIHGDKYDYSLVEYQGYEKNVEIVCRIHGKFLQKPKSHLYGKRGCIKCVYESNRLSLDYFLKRAKDIHGDKYDYSLVALEDSKANIEIICRIHGNFKQQANNHLSGSGCSACNGVKKISLDNFLKRAKDIHGDKYDYSLIKNIQNNVSKVKIICQKHGEFLQTPKSHLKGSGCNQCADESSGLVRRKTLGQFIIDARTAHGEKYDYSLVDYQTTMKKVKIICRIHGVFEQRPENHIHMKQGCSKCFHENNKPKGGYSIAFFEENPSHRNIPAILYVAKITNKKDHFYKIGITKLDLKMRFYNKKKKNMKITPIIEQNTTLFKAFIQEQHLLSLLKPYQYFPNNRFSGYTECLKINAQVEDALNSHFGINIT